METITSAAPSGGALLRPDPDHVEARFVEAGGALRQVPWPRVADDVSLEEHSPVRRFPVRHGRRVAPGWWWSATSGRMVLYGSGVMRTQVMLLDRDPSVVALACRPVELVWREGGRSVAHAPQVMARMADGSGLLLDCVGGSGPSARLVARARVASAAADAVGWRYRLVRPADPVLVANVRWLAGYRHPRCAGGRLMSSVMAAFGRERPAVEGVREVGDPIAVWPVLFHALWSGALSVRLDEPLHERALVSVTRGKGGVA